MLTLRISWLPNRSIFLLNLRLPHVADTADCVNQITAHDSGNFSIPPLLTFTRAIYRLLKLPLPRPIPEGSLLGAERCCASRCHLSDTNSNASAPFYSANLLIFKQLVFSNPVTTFCHNSSFYCLQVHIEGTAFSALLPFQARWSGERHF